MAHDSRCENANTSPADCDCECGGDKHGLGYAEDEIHELETNLVEIEGLKKLTPDEYAVEGGNGERLMDQSYLKLLDLIDESDDAELIEKFKRDKERLGKIMEARGIDKPLQYHKGEYVEVEKPEKLGIPAGSVNAYIESVSENSDGEKEYTVVYTEGEKGQHRANLRESEVKRPDEQEMKVEERKIHPGDTVITRHRTPTPDGYELRKGKVSSFGTKDGQQIVNTGNPYRSTGSWARENQIVSINGEKIRDYDKDSMITDYTKYADGKDNTETINIPPELTDK